MRACLWRARLTLCSFVYPRTMATNIDEATGKLSINNGIADALAKVRSCMKQAVEEAKKQGAFTQEPRLVAVSKTKPLSAIIEAFEAGQRVFGENYPQELAEKAKSPEVPEGIQWRFIGTLQSNKVKLVVGLPGLVAIETITSEKLANAVNKNVIEKMGGKTLDVFIQVNSSGEENKGGVAPENVITLAKHICDNCPGLRLKGIMTIGQYGRVVQKGEVNVDFKKLVECRTNVVHEMGIEEKDLELSMGMSGDFEHAIELGSTNIRVGSTIFGARDYQKK
eukprot:m.16468 g.16468  ORF g.16468 m.16468 type:complete len:280 (+) comp5710_c0_seq1:56-895(+)